MTRPKLPLPTLRFVIVFRGHRLYELIPYTDKKGRVRAGYWAVPGGRVVTTQALTELCQKRGWRYKFEGEGISRRWQG